MAGFCEVLGSPGEEVWGNPEPMRGADRIEIFLPMLLVSSGVLWTSLKPAPWCSGTASSGVDAWILALVGLKPTVIVSV